MKGKRLECFQSCPLCDGRGRIHNWFRMDQSGAADLRCELFATSWF